MKKGNKYKNGYIKENIYAKYLVVPERGRDITIGEFLPEIFISEKEQVYCYTGICTKPNPSVESCFVHPFYTVGKHSNDEELVNKIQGFYRLTNGHIIIDDYVDKGIACDLMYKRIPASIRFPGSSCCYGVFINETEDRDLTRAVFGLCYDDIMSLTECYAKAIGSYTEFETIPVLTRSSKSVKFCNATGLWIPTEFPYIAFDDTPISLYGFYQHINLLTNCRITSKIARMLIEEGLDEKILEHIFDIDQYTRGHILPSENFFSMV